MKSDRDKERVFVMTFQQIDRFGGYLAIGLILIVSFGGKPPAPFDATPGEISPLALFASSRAFRIGLRVPCFGIVRLHARVEYLSDAGGEVPGLAEQLRQSHDVRKLRAE